MTQNKGEDGGVDTFIENMVLNPSEGRYGVNVGKNVWHTVEALEPGSVIFECKEGRPYVGHEEEGILEMSDVRSKMCYDARRVMAFKEQRGEGFHGN